MPPVPRWHLHILVGDLGQLHILKLRLHVSLIDGAPHVPRAVCHLVQIQPLLCPSTKRLTSVGSGLFPGFFSGRSKKARSGAGLKAI